MTDANISEKSVQPTTTVKTVENTDGKVLLSVQDLRVWFELRRFGFGHAGYVHAVDGVNFDLHDGEAIAVVGESGCGKSSLMKTILRLYRPTKGQVVFQGKNIGEMKVNALTWYRSQVGYIQQDPYGAMAPFMTIERILEEPMIINTKKSRSQRLQRIEQSLTEVKVTPIEDFLPKFPHMLSGGQQQRIVIARSMILDPKLIVADEPVSMLDASVRVEILKLLRGLQEDTNWRSSILHMTFPQYATSQDGFLSCMLATSWNNRRHKICCATQVILIRMLYSPGLQTQMPKMQKSFKMYHPVNLPT